MGKLCGYPFVCLLQKEALNYFFIYFIKGKWLCNVTMAIKKLNPIIAKNLIFGNEENFERGNKKKKIQSIK